MKQTFTGVQILRFVAAMLVVVMHVTQAISIHITGGGEHAYWGTGAVGVDIFFVISGFVMAVSTAAMPATGALRREAAWVFVKRRIVRIVPVYWFYTLLKVGLLVAIPALAVKSTLVPAHIAASLAFVPTMAPWGLMQPILPVGWTLNFEMMFYIVFAAAIALGAPRIRFCLLVFLSLFLAARLLPDSVALNFYAQTMVFEFVIGVGIAQMMMRWGWASPAAGAVLLAAGLFFTFAMGWDPASDRLYPWGLGATAIVLGTLWLERVIERAPLAKPLAFLGDASYSIYLSHTFVVPAGVLVLKKLGIADPAAVFVLVSAACVAAGCASYLWIEKPLIAVAKRLLFRTPQRVPAHAAHTATK